MVSMLLSDYSTSLFAYAEIQGLTLSLLPHGKTWILASRGFPTSVTNSSGVSSLYICTHSNLMIVEL